MVVILPFPTFSPHHSDVITWLSWMKILNTCKIFAPSIFFFFFLSFFLFFLLNIIKKTVEIDKFYYQN